MSFQKIENSLKVEGDILVNGSIDGRNVATDGSNLDSHIANNSIHEIITASNQSGDQGIFSSKVGSDLQFKSLNAGNNIQLESDTNSITISSTNSGGTGSVLDINVKAFDVYDTTGGQDFTDVPITLNLDTIRKNTGQFSLSNNIITVNETGLYNIMFRTSIQISSGNTRTISYCWLERDTGGGFVELDGTRGWMYNRNSAQGENTATIPLVIDINSGDQFRIRVARWSSSDTLRTLPDGSGITLVGVGGIGEQGPQGLQGPTGSGSTVNIKDQSSFITGTPFQTLDFVGSSVSATDGGSGTATITINGGVFGSDYHYDESENINSTTSNSYQQKLRLTTNSLSGGDYKITWFYQWRHTSTTNDFEARIQVDDTMTIANHLQEPKDSNSDQLYTSSGFKKINLSSGVHNIDIDYRRVGSSGTAYIWNARLEIFRVL